MKVIAINLEEHSSDLTPQMREYFKGRVYALLNMGVRPAWVDGRVNYGPIDRKVLGPIVVNKGPESDEELYCLAMKAAGSKPAWTGASNE